ncbi:TM0106 family RecB-like putative nuclease [Pseudarthrobacter sp. N5]|uniref:TM0106 family RecB-like putative nuclease n=1 Tax=Pseudarthrobacter sp. N5 TaxID=3418416 RepID=UPI003CF59599
MFLLEPLTDGGPEDLVFSASDLVSASECEYRTLRVLDEKLGRSAKADFPADEMQQRAGKLGDIHELNVLGELTTRYGEWDPSQATGVYRIERGSNTRAELAAKHQETVEALTASADVVFQATFFDGEFLGYADFLVKEGADQPAANGGTGRYAVWDTKLARHAKVGALLQLAAYGDQLIRDGFEPAPKVTLVLGHFVDGEHPGERQRARSIHSLTDLLPVFRERRDRFRAITAAHRSSDMPVQWQQTGITHCGRCNYCAEQVANHRDLLMVSGMTSVQRKKLINDHKVSTIDALAEMPQSDAKGSLVRLRDQARMQTGRDAFDGSRTFIKDGEEHAVTYKVLGVNSLGGIPAPSPGDIFFDFEGDPLWQDSAGRWGLEYLFGVIEAPGPGTSPDAGPAFRPFWAHSRGGERKAFLDFLAYVEQRRAIHPEMHVYHYAPYEKSALRNLSVTHGAGEDIVDAWLKEGVLVDLYAAVRQSLRISEASYSIKKLEPLYMGNNLRSGDVKDAGASVVAYAAYCAERDAGHQAEAARVLASISDYNEYDCLSTLRLRDWLLQLRHGTRSGAAAATQPAAARTVLDAAAVDAFEPEPEELALQAYLASLPDNRAWTADEQAIAMVAAATGYHRREDKQFWWEHYDRLGSDPDKLSEARNVFMVECAEVLQDWSKAKPTERMLTRTTRLRGTMTAGSDFRPGSKWFRMFDAPVPEGVENLDGDPLAWGGIFATVIHDVVADTLDPRLTLITIAEKASGKVPPYPQFPMALTADKPIPTASIEAALREIAREVGRTVPSLPNNPGLDILRKRSPRLRTRATLPAVQHDHQGQADYVTAITEAVENLDHSYLAVQGPPGTGKTHVGSHVIAELVKRGWKVGVVGQSHAVVENMLRTAVEKAGVDPTVVAKKLAAPHHVPWTHTAEDDFARLFASAGGCLIGGTAWTLTGKFVPAGSLDLLVIDEAGQYSLANTLAVSRAAKRLLLLGDPQQLPQVTQGKHPEPVDESALGWLSAGHATLPAELGYFLADSWRMHPELCRAVSVLSYDGKLESAPAALLRKLDEVPAGVDTVFVEHTGNATASDEEAAEVVRQAERHIGLKWTPGGDQAVRPLEQKDVLVVAAYNAQVQLIRAALDGAGLNEVRAGTVDKFQGQEAPVVLVSMACSAIAEAPRGAEFLLNRNRINVAVSRGQWRAVIIRSPGLSNYMPTKPAGLEELGAFIGLSKPNPGE